jgi:hypothetical protein
LLVARLSFSFVSFDIIIVKDLKLKIKHLFGAPLFTPNLAYFELWDDLMGDCKAKALEMGLGMQKYFEDNDLGAALGAAAPNLFGRLLRTEGSSTASASNILSVVPCSEKECTKRQDCVLPMVFPRKPECSQVKPYDNEISGPKYNLFFNAGSLSLWQREGLLHEGFTLDISLTGWIVL